MKNPSSRYETSSMAFFQDKHSAGIREFGADEFRKLRYILESSNPHMINNDERYKKIMLQMKKQQDKNSNDPIGIRER